MGGVISGYSNNGKSYERSTAQGFTDRSDAINPVNMLPNYGGGGQPFDPNDSINDVTNNQIWNSEVRMDQLVRELMNTGEYMEYTYGTNGRPEGVLRTRDTVIDTNELCTWDGVRGRPPTFYGDNERVEIGDDGQVTRYNENKEATSDIFNSNILSQNVAFTKALPPESMRTTSQGTSLATITETSQLARERESGWVSSSWSVYTLRTTTNDTRLRGTNYRAETHTRNTQLTSVSTWTFTITPTLTTSWTDTRYVTYADTAVVEDEPKTVALPRSESQSTSYTYIGTRFSTGGGGQDGDGAITTPPTDFYAGEGDKYDPNARTYKASTTKQTSTTVTPPSDTINVVPSAYTTTEYESGLVCPATWNNFSTSHGTMIPNTGMFTGSRFCYSQAMVKTITKYK